jgi:hypothetical protein
MPDLTELQTSFLRYLTGRGGTCKDLVVEQGGVSADTRLGIYRNAYRLRLRDTIETDHEMLGRYLGDDLFEDMVDRYIRECPSQCFSLRDFTAGLPRFLRKTPPFSDHPILSELAAFERLLLDVFDAREAPRVNLDGLRAVAPVHWPTLRLRFHPSTQLFGAQWNSVESWRALKDDNDPPAATRKAKTSHWLLWRGAERLSHFLPVSPIEHALLVAALHGEPFSAMCERMTAWVAEDQVSGQALGLLQKWLDQGLIVRLDV